MARLSHSLPQAVLVRTLQQCRLFDGVPPVEIRRLAAVTQVRQLAAGDFLFHEGAPAHGVFLVRSGAVKVHRVNLLGREQVIHIFRSGESFGEESLMSEAGQSADACATEPTEVLLIRREGFLRAVRRRPELALCLLRGMDRQVQILIGLLDDLTLKDVKTRVAHWLIHQCPDPESRQPVSIQLSTTKRILAAELGTVSETLSRTVAKFRALNLITVEGSRVILLDPSRLKRLFGAAQVATPDPALTAALWAPSRVV